MPRGADAAFDEDAVNSGDIVDNRTNGGCADGVGAGGDTGGAVGGAASRATGATRLGWRGGS